MEMEEPSDSGVSESGLAEPGLWLPDFIEKLQSVKLTPQEDRIPKKDISQEEIISYKSSPCSLQRYNELSPEAASQVPWATGTYSGRIPNGFYSVIPAHSPQKMAALVSKQIHLRGALRLALSCFEQDATGSVDKKLKEMFKTIPSLDELSSMGIAGSRAEAVLVDVEKDKKLFMLKQWSAALLKGHHSNPASIIKKLAKLVSECYKRSSDQSLGKKYTEETSQLPENKGFSLLGQVRVASCRPRALLFKALADAVNLECKLIVGVPTDGPVECMDSYKHLSAVVVLNSVELLVDLTQFPGQLIPFSSKAIFKYHISAAGESDSADNDSCDSPLEPNSPLCGLSDKLDGEGSAISSHEHEEGIQSLNNRQAETSSIASPPLRNVMMQSLGLPEGTLSTHHSEPNIANAVWRPDSRRKAVAEQHTASSSPEHPLFWARGRSILARSRQSIREHTDGAATSRSVGASTTEPLRIRRRSISIAPEIGDDIVRAVRAMNEALKQNKCQGNEDIVSYSHREKNSCRDVSATCSNLRNQSNTSSNQKSMSLPSSPHEFSAEISERNGDTELKRRDFLSIWNRVLQSSPFVNQPLLPFDVWNIDYSELRVGARVGIGCFGEVFHGIWNGTDVAIKVFLEQDLTAENMEIFCNEISILSRLRHPNVILFLGACMRPPRLSMVTEYMEMGSLYYLIHTGGQKEKLSWHRRIKILQDICRGLMCMHRMKIVHRDLKSANCLVDRHWTVKICDFGLSRMITDAPMRDSSSAGTPEWMAPELIRNEPFTEKCDIFSLGVIMWELCTLSRPWKGVPPVQVIYAVASKGMQLHIPEGPLGKLIADCWAEPDERPSCQGVLSQLLDCNCTLC